MKKQKYTIILLLLLIGIGFAYISTNLSINGRGLFGKSDWKIYFDNIRVIEGEEFEVSSPVTVDDTTTDISFEVTLPRPGDSYKFFVDIVNDGSTDAMINILTNTNIDSSYCDYKITYYDGVELNKNDLLKENSRDILLVEIAYKEDIDLETMTSDKDSVVVNLSLEYSVADKNSKEREHINRNFHNDSWQFITTISKSDIFPYNVGDTKCVHLEGFSTTNDNGCNGDFKVRVANVSSPTDCEQEKFSKSACGFVLEFEDIVDLKKINSAYTNVGGWTTSDMRRYLNNELLLSFPDVLKNNIIETYSISGNGLDDSTGTGPDGTFESNDKLYLLSTAEIWSQGTSHLIEDDTGFDYTRQLDYYRNFGVDTYNIVSYTLKKYDGTVRDWWLRSAVSQNNISFYRSNIYGKWSFEIPIHEHGVSPAFRLG